MVYTLIFIVIISIIYTGIARALYIRDMENYISKNRYSREYGKRNFEEESCYFIYTFWFFWFPVKWISELIIKFLKK
ncbi:hypothetical protein CCYN74_430042 [Capnocytophaga cynodegmi]|uniref:Uncharacterized protein n=1 Tax=Capnocytophaga cynodegmi TaxID=28189 RepID=A0A0B7HRS2_9FLAO|nr:hypothetical protein CCYN74_430042 [Capnocytophaga cynodegmi]